MNMTAATVPTIVTSEDGSGSNLYYTTLIQLIIFYLKLLK